jgi:hypothetical protein
MATARKKPRMVHHPKAPGTSPERLRRALGSIPYHGPVIKPTLGERPDSDRPAERARD